jgi:hypothetical protein
LIRAAATKSNPHQDRPGESRRIFSGLDLVDPGVVPLLAWRPDGAAPENPRAAAVYAAIGRKP